MDNVYIERLWRSLKQEGVYRRTYEMVGETRKGIVRYLHCFNEKAPTGGLTTERPTTYSTNESRSPKQHNPTQRYT